MSGPRHAAEIIVEANGLRFPALQAGEGELVLLLHGFPDTPETFAAQIPAIADAGFRVLAPTLRGYAPENQPADGDYRAIRMAEDVLAIADALGASTFHLVGHDWGATIAFAAARLSPERATSLTMLAVPHPARFGEAYIANADQQARSSYILRFQSPDAEEMIRADDFAYLEALWRLWSPHWEPPAAALEAMRKAFGRPGVPEAALSYYRQALDGASEEGQRTQRLLGGSCTVPTLGLCGSSDGCIGAGVFRHAMRPDDFPEGLSVEEIAGAGHFLHRERPEEVNRFLFGWLRRHPATRDLGMR